MSARKRFKLPLLPTIFGVIIVVTLIFAFLKIFNPETKTVYVKMIVSQGLWWSATGKPDVYFTKAIKSGDTQYSSLGKPEAEVTSTRYYPTIMNSDPSANKYDIFLTVKLNADYNPRTEKYTFSRIALEIGAPISIDTSTTQITGTVIDLSQKPFKDNYVEKTVTLTKKFAYPWEYNAVKIGDSYFDGQDEVFKVISKTQRPAVVLSSDYYGNYTSSTLDANVRYITVTAKVKLLEKDGQLFFGQNTLLSPGASFTLWTKNFAYSQFLVSEIK